MWLHAWVRYEAPQYDDYDWPLYSEVLGLALTVFIVLPIIVVPIVCYITASGSFFKVHRLITASGSFFKVHRFITASGSFFNVHQVHHVYHVR